MSSEKNASEKRIYGLDILRSIAILTVVAEHAGAILIKNKLSYGYLSCLLWDGVSIFFVLSGFLIGGIFIRTVNDDKYAFPHLLGFWIRRWFRTLPNYYLMILILLPTWYLVGLELPHNLVKYFFFLQNFHDRHPNFFGEAWSLCVEEWFYLLFPLLATISIVLFKIEKRYVILFWAFFFIICCTGIRSYRLITHGYLLPIDFNLYIKKQVVTRLDSLMFGVLGAYLLFYHKTFWAKYQLPFFVVGFILLLSQNLNLPVIGGPFYQRYILITANSIGTLMVLPQLSSLKLGKGAFYSFFTRISKISYSMYIVHASFLYIVVFPLVFSTVNQFFANNYLRAGLEYVLFWALTIGLSQLMYSYFEHPIMKLRDRIKVARYAS